MARITLRISDDLHESLRRASRGSNVSLNQFVVAALSDAIGRAEGSDQSSPLDEEVRQIRLALGDLIVNIGSDPSQEVDAKTRNEVRRKLRESVRLTPPLSRTIIEERGDRL